MCDVRAIGLSWCQRKIVQTDYGIVTFLLVNQIPKRKEAEKEQEQEEQQQEEEERNSNTKPTAAT